MASNFSNETTLYIQQYLHWRDNKVMLNGNLLFELAPSTAVDSCMDFYNKAAITYPKFFKMDLLSKAAFLSANTVLPKEIEEDRLKIATVLSSKSGCLDVDKKFRESQADIASPALFVYTLPNIMLGEICIANGFKGEQMCTLTDETDCDWFDFYINDLIKNRGTEAALCGHVEATASGIEALMIWVNKQTCNILFNLQNLSAIFGNK
ncbi:hypothetical protein F0919_09885 [Taibaiella lutea]|uniref:3-oxoacyl-ACP synthase n=1 Tax=Taibaiella lutea TaxID=2608001 RepID=A0A5M6CI65_9BACT|nr:hypothetical protein [Taibaiella lutea]KAA5534901.1 hypothetical protein F0919_09885 [Taibaiella lutea]